MSEKSEPKTVVKVSHVAKSFRLPKEHSSELKQTVINFVRGKKGYTNLHVLRDISFEVHEGDFFGIVGRNGSGKSTLLKLLAGIYQPSKGKIETVGKIVPFIELGVGFNPELTGRENVYMNGAMLGFSNEEVNKMYRDIVEFSELDKFMDQKLKNYSSGMQVRLAFSIAIKAQGDILILDEVLAVGDEAFQRKCDDYFQQIKKDKTKTVILVTHDMSSVRKYCDRAICIRDGDIVVAGSPDDVANTYTEDNFAKKEERAKNHGFPVGLNETVPKLALSAPRQLLTSRDRLEFSVNYSLVTPRKDIFLAIAMLDVDRGGIPYDSSTRTIPLDKNKTEARFALPLHLFNDGNYRIKLSVWAGEKDKMEQLAYTTDERALDFSIRNDDKRPKYPLLRDNVLKIERLK